MYSLILRNHSMRPETTDNEIRQAMRGLQAVRERFPKDADMASRYGEMARVLYSGTNRKKYGKSVEILRTLAAEWPDMDSVAADYSAAKSIWEQLPE
jgi:spore coat protein CotH